MKKTIALLIILSVAYGHAYTGNYCLKDKTICLNINPGGKAELVVDKVSIACTYTQKGDNFLVTGKTAANQVSKDLIVKKVKKDLESTLGGSFDSDKAWRDCNWEAERIISSNIPDFGLNGKRYKPHEVAKCAADAERAWSQRKQDNDAFKQRQIRELKYNDDLLEEFMRSSWFLGVPLVNEGLNFTLVGNSLYGLVDCSLVTILTKSGSKGFTFEENNTFCLKGAIYNKCGGKVYDPNDTKNQKCENNVVLSSCGNGWYNEDRQFCSGNTIKDYEKYTDSRDGKTYKTVAINNQTWLAENLNYAVAGSKCYDDKLENCNKYGRLYDWDMAIKSCPEGWRLPSYKELATLTDYVGGATKLKSRTGWKNDGNGSNDFGFTALPSGDCDEYGCSLLEYSGDLWTAKGYGDGYAYYYIINYRNEKHDAQFKLKRILLGVRCVQGAAPPVQVSKKVTEKRAKPWREMPEDSKNALNSAWAELNKNTSLGQIYISDKGQNLGSNVPTDNGTYLKAMPGGKYQAIKVEDDPANYDNAKPSSEAPKAPSDDVKPSNGGIKTSTFKDPRDGKEYKFVKIGKQTWMAENLNYNYKGSKCYGENATNFKMSSKEVQANCEKYGRLYVWNAAKDACPKGWHLPSHKEWMQLGDFAGIIPGDKEWNAGKLKAKSGWTKNNGTDAFGFSALPGGSGDYKDGDFYEVGTRGIWWSATENKKNAVNWDMNSEHNALRFSIDGVAKTFEFSVRCVQD